MIPSVFTKIVKGLIPSYTIFEDDLTMAFLDINPIQEGMVVVIPKRQIDNFIDLDDTTYQAFMKTVKTVSKMLDKTYPDKRIGVVIEGFEVPHAHAKLIPISSGADLGSKPIKMSPEQLKTIASRIVSNKQQ